MNKLLKSLLALLLLITAVISVPAVNVQAEEAKIDVVRLSGDYIYNTKKEMLDRINEIRKEACDEGVTLTSGRKLTKKDYVPIKWSSDLEEIARVRAVEAAVYGSHTRPNGQLCFSVKSKSGKGASGEILAWGTWYDFDTLSGIERWYVEKEDLINKTGGDTGHYEALINPNNLYIGLATANHSCAGELSSSAGVSENLITKKNETFSMDVELLTQQFDATLINGDEVKNLFIKESATLNFVMNGFYNSLDIVNSSVAWKSSDKSVVKVDKNGKVTALKEGKATITTTINGKKYSTKITVKKCGWKLFEKGWSYYNENGTWSKSKWQKIDGKWYHFDSKGYMQTGWLKDGNKWYYLKPSGAMATGWVKITNYYNYPTYTDWYYCNSSGAMQTGWKKISGKWYYFYGSGLMAANTWIGNYHVNASGAWDY